MGLAFMFGSTLSGSDPCLGFFSGGFADSPPAINFHAFSVKSRLQPEITPSAWNRAFSLKSRLQPEIALYIIPAFRCIAFKGSGINDVI